MWSGYSENVNPPVINNLGSTNKFDQHGDQYEGGIKTALDDGKINLTATYFNIDEHNVFVYDAISNTFLPLGDVTSKGFELEGNARINANLTVIGAASHYKARNSFGQLLRSVPDSSGALAVKYQFTDGLLKNFWLMPSGNYVGRRAGDIPSTINIQTSTMAPGTVVGTVNGRDLNGDPVQPTFYLPARTLVNLTAGYTWGAHWVFWMRVDNLLDKKYIAVALNRSTVTPGTPTNVSGSIEYKF